MKNWSLYIISGFVLLFCACGPKDMPVGAQICPMCEGDRYIWPSDGTGISFLIPEKCEYCNGYGWIMPIPDNLLPEDESSPTNASSSESSDINVIIVDPPVIIGGGNTYPNFEEANWYQNQYWETEKLVRDMVNSLPSFNSSSVMDVQARQHIIELQYKMKQIRQEANMKGIPIQVSYMESVSF